MCTYERLAMEKFLVVCLINHMIGCMIWHIENNPADMALSDLLSMLVVVDG